MIVLIGKSCSGKDTVTKLLLSMGYKKAITCTTRPMRNNEIDGQDYYFVTQEEFMNMIINNKLAEYRSYETEKGIWLYGSRIDDYAYSTKKVIILTPDGLKNIKEKYPKLPITSFYLKVSNKELKRRMFERAKISGENIKEVRRRYKADKKDFRNVEKLVDCIIDNEKDAFETALFCKEYNEIKEKNNRRKER